MSRQMHAFISRKAIAVTLLTALISTSALAYQAPSTGLGQSWPNATDVSTSPHYHVYVFVRDGIRYIQVNDLNGTVLSAVAVADHEVLVLPVGADEPYVTASQATSAKASSSTETVYNDGATQLTAEPVSDGTVKFGVVSALACPYPSPYDCTGNVISRIGS
jgi:hypothetical protein